MLETHIRLSLTDPMTVLSVSDGVEALLGFKPDDFLAGKVGAAATEMEPLAATMDRYADLPEFRHLQNYGDLQRANMSRAFTEFESQ
jgi:hypothetical protein